MAEVLAMVITIVAIVGQHDHHDEDDQQHQQHHGGVDHHHHHRGQAVVCMVRLTLWTVAVETPVAAATARIE